MNTGKNLQIIDPITPGRDLPAYIASVNSIAVLTPEHELELAKQYYYTKCGQRGNGHGTPGFVVHMAKTYSLWPLSGRPDQEGCRPDEGASVSIRKGVRLVSFAVHWIKAEMHGYILRNWRIVEVATKSPTQTFLQPSQLQEKAGLAKQ